MDVHTDSACASGRVAQVLLPLPLWEAYDYAEPEGLELQIGDIVVAPLGPRTVTGVVSGFKSAAGTNRRLRPIIGRLDAPRMPPRALVFARWAADYAADAPGAALALALRGLGAPRPSPREQFVASGQPPARPTPARLKVLSVATAPMTRAELARASAVSAGVIADLIRVGALVAAAIDQPNEVPRHDASPSALNDSQAAAADAISAMVEAGSFGVALLDGVTGSGKTEVYLEAAAAALRKSPGSQVLVLLPEIALTAAVIRRFEARFGAAPAQWHSGVAGPRRRETWEAVAEGRSRIVVGARSALFLPFGDLRLIIVDEEHDASYKQDEGFVYHARDLAVARGKIEGAPVVLASATPSLETLWNARSGRYRHLRLEDRHGVASLPDVSLVDLRQTPPETGRWLSPPLVNAVRETLERGEQSLLFLNRRGYAPLVICRSCGERMKAPDTDSWLVEHRYSRRLVCHLTGFSMPRPERCPACAAADSLVSVGPGVERVEEEARLLFPQARIVVFSSDTAPDARSARVLIEAMERGDFDIMVATQSAAKGHNFPRLTLVGVVDADVGLRGGDLRAAERTYQLLTQVAGRAGRADRPGRALIQTWSPEHAVMQAIASQDRDGFVSAELSEREALGLPPFGRLAAVILSSPRGDVLEDFARAFAAAAPNAEGVTIFGPADAPLALVRGRRRKRFLVRAERSVDLQSFLLAWRARRPPPNSVRIDVDVDPYNFL
jgi:primosomal protein N' (replication factor Y) (superfamily II helicase)